MASNVFFMNDRASSLRESMKFKAVKLFRDAGLGELFKPGDTVGVKIHMGEYGNSMNLRPQLVGSIIEEIKALGGRPAIVDCNTICFSDFSSRAARADHLRTAARHGFTEETMGCPIWICDGDYGFDDVKVEVPHGVFLKHSYMGKRLTELDSMIVVTHFKGHPRGVFGGALKNVGIGCGSKRGKIGSHLFSHPTYGVKSWTINQEVAATLAQQPHPNMIDRAIRACAFDALSYENGVFSRDDEKCNQCGMCQSHMLRPGLATPKTEGIHLLSAAFVDACSGYLHAIGKDKVGYVSYALDIAPQCDCLNFHDRAMVPNIGVFASKDPVAIDMACVEATEAVHALPGSSAITAGCEEPWTERFTNCSSPFKTSQWTQINAGVFNGIGTSEYKLITSEPATDAEFWMKPYTEENVWGHVNREALRAGNFVPEYPYSYDTFRLSIAELSTKPAGMVE